MTGSKLPQGVPEGFVPLPAGLGFTDALQPSFRRISSDGVSLGLLVRQQHCNILGNCHGGVLSTLADIAAASGVITGPEGVVARFNGTFYLPDHDGIWRQPPPEAGLLSGE